MPRRRSSAFEDFLSSASRRPWKVSIGLAAISYIGLHLLALRFTEQLASAKPSDLASIVILGYVRLFAVCAQYIVPAGFLLGAVISYLKRRRSIGLADEARAGRDVMTMSWQEFERLVGEGFRQQGFQVTDRGGSSPDGGADAELTKAGKRYLVQCKQWRAVSGKHAAFFPAA